MCCTRLAGSAGPKKSLKITIWAPSHIFVGLYLIFATNSRIDIQKKKLLNSNTSSTSSEFGELRPTNGWDLLASLRHPSKFQRVRVLAALLHGTLVVGVSQILQPLTEGATYIRQGGHHVGNGPHSSFSLWFFDRRPQTLHDKIAGNARISAHIISGQWHGDTVCCWHC